MAIGQLTYLGKASPTVSFAVNNQDRDYQLQMAELIEYLNSTLETGGTQELQDNLANSSNPALGAGMIGYAGRTVYARLQDIPSLDDYGTSVVDGVTSNQDRLVAAAAANQGKKVWIPAKTYVSTATIPGIHGVEWFGPGVIKSGTDLFRPNPSRLSVNTLYMAPGGTGDGLSASRPLGGFAGAIAALNNYAPLNGRWTISGAAGTYNEAVALPDWIANGANYLAFSFPAVSGPQAEPATYSATLSGTGINALQGFLSGAGNKISISNLCIANWFDTDLPADSQVRRGFSASTESFAFLQNCAFTGNGLSNISALPGGSITVNGGVLNGSRYVIDDTGGRISLSATPTTYSVVRNGLEYGIYQKHDSSTVCDYTEFRNNGKLAAAVSYGAAIFAYKSNASVDTRGCKFYQNNICWNVRGGFVADNPGIPDVYGTGIDANTRRFLCRAGGVDDISSANANSIFDIGQRFGGGSTTSATDALLLDAIASTREGYLSNVDQCLRINIIGRAITGDALITPLVRHAGGTVALGTFRIAAGAYGEIRLIVRPTTARNALQVLFACTNAIQNLGIAVGQIISAAVDLPNVALSVEINGRAEGGGTCQLIACTVDRSA